MGIGEGRDEFDGLLERVSVGIGEGRDEFDGELERVSVGISDGCDEIDGTLEELSVGMSEGSDDGLVEGCVGLKLGDILFDGETVGFFEGGSEGGEVGDNVVGVEVGDEVVGDRDGVVLKLGAVDKNAVGIFERLGSFDNK